MTLYKEDDFLQLSGIQHFAFCKRQWALAYIELQWADNLRTVEGELLHKRVHDESYTEKRGELIISRGMPIHSATLGVSGECDVVEFRRDDRGIALFGREGLYTVTPIEYKKGKPKKDDIDILQLTAQAMCIEEMLCCKIEYGYIYYGETRHRITVQFSDELREKVQRLFNEMHQMFDRRYTPKVKRTKSCNACSIKDICLPALNKRTSVEEYVSQHIDEDEV